MQIPNCKNAVVDIQKIRDYSLNSEHRTGTHKARVFLEKLGLTQEDVEFLRETILNIVCDENAIEADQIEYGQLYTVDFVMRTQVGSAYVRTGWIIRNDENFPRLTSCYVLPRKRVEDE